MDAHLINTAIEAATKPGAKFTWGTDDCCTFVCDVVEKQTGLDLMASLRGRYTTPGEAEALWATDGGLVPLIQRLAAEHHLLSVAFPFTGADLGIVATPNGPALAVFLDNAFYGRTEDGAARLPARMGVLAWRLP